MAAKLKTEEFIEKIASGSIPILDARSESEFAHSHIPGAINFPLLRDEERKIVGTIYKQQGREAAVTKGFELVGPRFHSMITEALARFKGKELLMYCWRGGMRSQITAWLLGMAGFRISLLEGGYKAYRSKMLDVLLSPRSIQVLGGQTGSGKTEVLVALKNLGEQVIDLEGLACHKGSAFGGIGQPAQPSNEQFENLLGLEWMHTDPSKTLWLENESRHIGTCVIPENIYRQIRESLLVELIIPIEYRKKRITADYGKFPMEHLASATQRIGKRLGPQHMKSALEDLYSGNFEGWLDTVLSYYDKLYAYGTSQRDASLIIPFETTQSEPATIASEMLQYLKKNHKRVLS